MEREPSGSAGYEPPRDVAEREAASTALIRDTTLASPALTGFAGGAAEVRRMLETIEPVWLDHAGLRIHCDLHRAAAPRSTVVFQPGSGSHARFYFLLGGLLARCGHHVLAVDRTGHGLSDGVRGDCTMDEAIAIVERVMAHARTAFGLPVVLMGSSLGGLLTIFALLRGARPDLAVAHNFVFPGKLVSMRLRARWIARRRTRPYPLTELVHGFERLSDDPAITRYLRERADPCAAWELSPRSVASLFGFTAAAPAAAPETLVLTGDRDTAIPAWATRLFAWWAGLPRYDVRVLPDAGHLLFHDHLDVAVPVVSEWLDARLAASRSGEVESAPCG